MTTEDNLPQRRRAWAIRMARVGLPDYQIAFTLGVSIEDLRLNFAGDMQRSAIYLNLLILENLARQALSFHGSAATRFWVKHRIWLKSESKNSRNSNETNEKERTWGWGNPEDITFRGPNGETE